MHESERHRLILGLVRETGFVGVTDLSRRFGVTPQTVRRDINRLDAEGLLRRLHGGAGPGDARDNLAFETRQDLNLDAKRRIAALVAGHVADGSSLSIGIGTTPEAVAGALVHKSGLRILTNNLNAAFIACGQDGFDVTIAGGRLRQRGVIGDAAVDFFAGFKVDIAVFGVGSVDPEDGTLLDFDREEVRTRLSMAANARQSFLVLDHSKFGRPAVARGGNLCDVDAIFTERPLPPAMEEMAMAAGVAIHVADSEAGGAS
ncbi:DeoR/GlpR family DNA-binding transcription regulator [Telmatospirillum siberiense]|uniref:DeoR family transcriptional regulator n=1 Tax=Telmatospirillum siberiense TaxID=382514 RepID=A0A2N3PVC8_9PROT|nr:DeoR/GlpR family DNA-binding transcription regulator [Telmatospirillum siberiense]PKU24348.1 DeoR family transcriptional regulator [Telmatospirillum siberiense]